MINVLPQWRVMRHLSMLWMLVVLLATADRAIAADIYISAQFVPNVHDPNKRTFENTTPWSGLCSSPGHNATCIARGIWSIDTQIRGTKRTRGSGNRNDFYFGMPGPRALVVTNDAGETFPMTVRIVGMGYRYGDGFPTHGGGGLTNCTVMLTNWGAGSPSVMRLFHRNDDGQGEAACWSATTNGHDGRPIEELDIVYELETPSPLEMPVGIYSGQATYSIGGLGQDIDLGDGVTLDSDVLTAHFSLEVKHAFQLRFPPGSDRAILAPQGGWTQWSDHGRVPSALVRELPFLIDSSGRFSVSLQCGVDSGDGRCAMQNKTVPTAADVPLDVSISMPGIHDKTLARPAIDYPLTTTMAAPVFTVDGYVLQRSSKLTFAVRGKAVEDMVRYPGSHYEGVVTVLFDADL